MEWNVGEWSVYITSASALVGFLIFMHRKVFGPLYTMFKTQHSIAEKIDFIFEELKPNSGKSIRDVINRIEKGLISASGFQKALLADHEDALFETDSEGNCIWMNRTYIRLVERTPAEILGHGWQNTIAQEIRKEFVEDWYSAVTEDREFTRDFSFETPSGRIIPVKVRSYKIPDSSGKSIGYLGYITVL